MDVEQLEFHANEFTTLSLSSYKNVPTNFFFTLLSRIILHWDQVAAIAMTSTCMSNALMSKHAMDRAPPPLPPSRKLGYLLVRTNWLLRKFTDTIFGPCEPIQ